MGRHFKWASTLNRDELMFKIRKCVASNNSVDGWVFSEVTDLQNKHVGFMVRYPVPEEVEEAALEAKEAGVAGK